MRHLLVQSTRGCVLRSLNLFSDFSFKARARACGRSKPVKITTPAQLNSNAVRSQDRWHRKIRSRQARSRLNSELETSMCVQFPHSLYMIRSSVQFLLFLDYILLCIHVFKQSHLPLALILALWHQRANHPRGCFTYVSKTITRTHMSWSMCAMLTLSNTLFFPHPLWSQLIKRLIQCSIRILLPKAAAAPT